MKAIGIIGIVISVICAIAGIAIAMLKIINTFSKAQMFSEMGTKERLFLRIIDKPMYENLCNSYVFMIGMPFIGDTL